MSDALPELDRLRLDGPHAAALGFEGHRRLSRKVGTQFLKGPIPLPWLCRAAQQPGKALAVAIAIWFEAGRCRSTEVILTTTLLKRFGVSRKAKYHALQVLEAADLIRVIKRSHRNPLVAILLELITASADNTMKAGSPG